MGAWGKGVSLKKGGGQRLVGNGVVNLISSTCAVVVLTVNYFNLPCCYCYIYISLVYNLVIVIF